MVLRRLLPGSGIIPVRYPERVFTDLRKCIVYELMLDKKTKILSI